MPSLTTKNEPQRNPEIQSPMKKSEGLSREVAQDVSTALNVMRPSVRMYLLRHYPYEDTSEWREYEECLKKRFTLKDEKAKERNLARIHELKNSGKINIIQDFGELPPDIQDIYKTILSNPTKTALFFHQEKEEKKEGGKEEKGRTEMTGENLRKHFPTIGFVGGIHLPGSSKDGDTGINDHNTNKEMETAVSATLEEAQGKYETIVIIGNRSYAKGFYMFTGKRELSHHAVEEIFENKSYFQIDVAIDEKGRYKKVIGETDKIQITPYNMRRIIESINKKEGKKMLRGDSTQDTEKQVNQFFHAEPHRFREYFEDRSMDEEVRMFCLANLLHRESPENAESVKQYLHNLKASQNPLPLEMLEVFLQSSKDTPLTREALLVSMLFTTDDAGKIAIANLCEKTKNMPLHGEMSSIVEILISSDKTAKDIFRKSLDTLVQKKELITRTLYTYRKRSAEELGKLREEKQGNISKEDEYTKISMDLGSILNSNLPHILIGHVGEGKSTELAGMKEGIDANPIYRDIIPLFYSAKTHNRSNIIEDIQSNIDSLERHFPEKKVVVFFDGIDELGGDIREDIVTGLKSLHSDRVKVILGSRPLGFDRYENTGIQAVHFEKIDKTERLNFLRSRLQNLKVPENEMKQKLKEIEEEFLEKPTLSEDLKETPLILFFLAKLCVDGKLGTIQNRADLYEKMIFRILTEHQGRKNLTWTKQQYKSLIETLSFCAIQKHQKQPISRESILGYLGEALQKNSGYTEDQEVLEMMADQIFLLYQLEGGEYQFILKSFEEYFLARYIWTQDKVDKNIKYPGATEGESIIYQMRDSNFESWNNWRNFRPVVMFYGEMLANSGDTDGLERFLGEESLLRNDDMFGEGFFMGLEILYKLPKQLKNKQKIVSILSRYEEVVKGWGIEEVVKKIGSITKFTKAIGNRDTVCSEKVIEIMKISFGVDLWKELAPELFTQKLGKYYKRDRKDWIEGEKKLLKKGIITEAEFTSKCELINSGFHFEMIHRELPPGPSDKYFETYLMYKYLDLPEKDIEKMESIAKRSGYVNLIGIHEILTRGNDGMIVKEILNKLKGYSSISIIGAAYRKVCNLEVRIAD